MVRKKKCARAIVTGHLEKVSSAIFEKFRDVITDMTMGQQGLYALYRKDKLYYVGLARNLRYRIPHHLKDRLKGMWTHFSLYIIRHPDHIKELESLLLCIAYPAGNKVRGKLKHSKNFLPLLKKKTKEAALKELETIFTSSHSKKLNHHSAMTNRAKKAWATRKKNSNGATARPCKGLFKKIVPLYADYKGVPYKAILFKTGRIKLNGKFYDSPSMAGSAIIGSKINGWWFWKAKNKSGNLVRLTELRN
jgi:hypothetical protein